MLAELYDANGEGKASFFDFRWFAGWSFTIHDFLFSIIFGEAFLVADIFDGSEDFENLIEE